MELALQEVADIGARSSRWRSKTSQHGTQLGLRKKSSVFERGIGGGVSPSSWPRNCALAHAGLCLPTQLQLVSPKRLTGPVAL